MWRVMQLLAMLALMPLIVLMHLVPALFQICIWLTFFFFLTGARLLGRPLDTGPLILLSGLLWSGIALLFFPWLQIVLVPTTALLVLTVIGAVWGLCIGGQVALHWELELMRLPDTDPRRQFGLPPHWFGHAARRQQPQDLDELFRSGVILGQTDEDEP